MRGPHFNTEILYFRVNNWLQKFRYAKTTNDSAKITVALLELGDSNTTDGQDIPRYYFCFFCVESTLVKLHHKHHTPMQLIVRKQTKFKKTTQ